MMCPRCRSANIEYLSKWIEDVVAWPNIWWCYSCKTGFGDGPVATGEVQATRGKNPAAVALGRLGGNKGGIARAKKLSPERRSQIARKAARARWAETR
jgi:hypothetical protein